jgi:hypothetical protein
MTDIRPEFEQKFTEALTSRAATVPRGAMGALDPHLEQRPEQDGRSPPRPHRRALSPDTGRLPRKPGGLRQQPELPHTGGKTMHPLLLATAIAMFVIVARARAPE